MKPGRKSSYEVKTVWRDGVRYIEPVKVEKEKIIKFRGAVVFEGISKRPFVDVRS